MIKKIKVLVVPDSFKGSLSAKEAADCISKGFGDERFEVVTMPVSDGGDGALDVVAFSGNRKKQHLKVYNALGVTVDTEYITGANGEAYVAVSGASGIGSLDRSKLNPFAASSYGTGQVIDYLLKKGVSMINLFLGGSATVDGGTGLMAALGAQFFKGNKKIVPFETNPLVEYDTVNLSAARDRLRDTGINVIADVDNVIMGDSGAVKVFGPQKGASEEDMPVLENRMMCWVELLEKESGRELEQIAGLGAAGGIALPLTAFADAVVYNGAQWFVKTLGIEKLIEQADLIVTGEGSIDVQTSMGKIPGVIANLAKKQGKKVIGLCGKLGGKPENFDEVYSILDHFNVDEEYALANAKTLLEKLSVIVAEKA